jgi:hypothetical protein
MKIQNSKLKVQSFGVVLLLLTAFCMLPTATCATEKWPGVDESVVEKYAKEHGREARDPLINTDQGDLLLFVFLTAGVVGGFAGGYYWRILMVENAPGMKRQELNIRG